MWVEIDPDEYARRFPAGARSHRSPVRKIMRHAAFAMAWLAALGAGAWSARWVDQNGGIEAALRKVLPLPQRPPRPEEALADRGTGAGDDAASRAAAGETGLRSAQVLAGPVPHAVAPTGATAPAGQTATRELVGREGSDQDGENDVVSQGERSSGAGRDAARDAGTSDRRAAAIAPKPRAKTAKTADKAVKPKSSDASDDRSAKAAKKPSSSTASPKVARGREISRIQAQAAEELKKKD
jgi:hypothetical protein